jgi:1-acyl-sn-glycerol-3-phosphate acyltransferase
MFNPLIAALRLAAFVAVTLVLLPPYLAAAAIGRAAQMRIAGAYWRIVVRMFGFRLRVWGAPLAKGPALLVSNHTSYLDIIVLGSLLPAFFVAKSEVAGWPGLGFLARIAHTVFVDRKRGATLRERDQMRRRLDDGDLLILFPEGTSSDGNRVLPFKSAFFAAAENHGTAALPVQPVSIAYTRLDGLPMQRAFRPFYAWYGGMTLADHLFAALGLGNPTVDVIFHPPVSVADFGDRKALANHCHDVIHRGVGLALAGRLPADGTPPVHPAAAAP